MKNAEKNVSQRVRIEYADQNEAFASLLPRSGVITRRCSDIAGNSDWCLLRLDEPFEYQLKVGEPFRHRLLHVGHLLVRSREAGHAVGETEPTAVFILLVDDTQVPVQDPFNPTSYVHIAWGTALAEA